MQQRVLTEALAIFEKKYGRDYDGRLSAIWRSGRGSSRSGRKQKLRDLLEREQRHQANQSTTSTRTGWARSCASTEAIALQRQALNLQKLHGENHRWTASAHRHLALSLRDSGDKPGADAIARRTGRLSERRRRSSQRSSTNSAGCCWRAANARRGGRCCRRPNCAKNSSAPTVR